jgi:hypothetical protein
VRRITALLLLVGLLAGCTALQGVTPSPTGSSRGAVRGLTNATEIVLASNAAQTIAFTGNAVNFSGIVLLVVLDVTAASGTTPTLDVKLQTTEDGTNWCDFAAFGQATVVSRQLIRIVQLTVPNVAQVACTDATLAAATVHQGPLGRAVRIKHALPGGTTPSFSYTIKAWVQD